MRLGRLGLDWVRVGFWWEVCVYVLDLFSGIGGFSLGLERAGMRTVAFCECDPYYYPPPLRPRHCFTRRLPYLRIGRYPSITRVAYFKFTGHLCGLKSLGYRVTSNGC